MIRAIFEEMPELLEDRDALAALLAFLDAVEGLSPYLPAGSGAGAESDPEALLGMMRNVETLAGSGAPPAVRQRLHLAGVLMGAAYDDLAAEAAS